MSFLGHTLGSVLTGHTSLRVHMPTSEDMKDKGEITCEPPREAPPTPYCGSPGLAGALAWVSGEISGAWRQVPRPPRLDAAF